MGRDRGLSISGIELARAAIDGNRLSLARLLTEVENDTPAGRAGLDWLFPHAGQAHLVGITGSPGTGKSSLVNRIALNYRNACTDQPPRKVAIVAIDPTSPYSGGALLGDRVRMRDLAGDPGVFIRSMAARRALGGLAGQTAAVTQVLDAVGFEVILIETVGAGQSEVDIARLAHTTIVVEAPGLGDEIQAIKAGILEIADILVINKADRPGLESTERALQSMLDMGEQHTGPLATQQAAVAWRPPIVRTVAAEDIGTCEVVEAIERHLAFLVERGEWRRRQYDRLMKDLDSMVQGALVERWRRGLPEDLYDEVLTQLCERRITPSQALEKLVRY